MGKKLSIIVMSLLAVSLMGCTQSAPDKDYEAKTQEVAGKENPPIEVQDLEILEQGFVYTVDEWDYAYASFGVIIENPNTDYAFTNTKARVSVKDSAGVILATQDYYINQMLPEEIYGFGDSIEIVGEAAEVAVTLIDGELVFSRFFICGLFSFKSYPGESC